MVRARTNRIVVSQRDIRQTTQPEPSQQTVSHVRSTMFCTWCREDGRHFGCLVESSQAICEESDAAVPSSDWMRSAMNSEGWVPASGPCCEDCLEAAFESRKKTEVGQRGRALVEETQTWCWEKGQRVRLSLQQGWKALCRLVQQAKDRWTPKDDRCEGNYWHDVEYEAEGFLEVKIVVTRQGAMQHLEVDFPTDVPISLLKHELATLIDVPAEAQLWFYQAQQVDETKTLDQLKVDIGAILEVKCQV